jgi:hypothetical protein
MSIQDQIRRHEYRAESNERICAQHLVTGNLYLARWFAQEAATDRHLANELVDTDAIASAARAEYLDQRIAARKQEANRG